MSKPVAMTQPENWVDEYGDVLYRYALARVRDPGLAEDLVQETFLAALKSRENFAGQSSVQTWLVTILKHKMVDHYRKTSRERNLDPESDPVLDADDAFFFTRRGQWKNGPHRWNVDPHTAAENREFRQALRRCLERLPQRLAAVFLMREMDDMNTEEICNAFAITPTNLWVMLHRARRRLRHCLEETWIRSYSPEDPP